MKDVLRECQADAAPVHPTKGELQACCYLLKTVESDLLHSRRRVELYFDCGPQQSAKRAVQDEEVQERARIHRATLQASRLGGCQNDLLAAGCRKGDLPSRCRILSLRRLESASSIPQPLHALELHVLAGTNGDCLRRVENIGGSFMRRFLALTAVRVVTSVDPS